MFKRASWLAAVALAIAAAGCSGSDGSAGPRGPQGPQGPQGNPGADLTASAKPEACNVCHETQGSQHQATYDQYTDATTLALTIDGVQTVGTTSAMTFHVAKDGQPVNDPGLAGMAQKTFYAVLWDPSAVFSTNISYDQISLIGDGEYVATASKTATFVPETSNAVAYGYVVQNPIPTEGSVTIYSDVSNAAKVYGTVDYVSQANVSACENCHGAPYRKHGYRMAKVAGLPDFVGCKNCHYDNRPGNDVGWQITADDPLFAATNGGAAFSNAMKAKYAYKARLMNDVHMSHAMEFAFPQSMSNCVTCHAGHLDATTGVVKQANFKLETCRSCHPVSGPSQAQYVDAKRAPALKTLMTAKTTNFPNGITAHNGFLDQLYANNQTATVCTTCHDGGFAPTFAQIHPGFDAQIYDAANSNARYSSEYQVTVDPITVQTNVLTIQFHATGVDPQVVASMSPTILVGLYGYDTKDFIVDPHGTTMVNGVSQSKALEYVVGSATPARFHTVTNDHAGNWKVTADLNDWASLISTGAVTRVEVGILPAAKVNGVTLALNAPSVTVNLKTGANGNSAQIVDAAKCNKCHDALGTTFHTGERGGNVTVCRLCHNVRNPAFHFEAQSRSIDSFVHGIHSFQKQDIGTVNFADPVFKARYLEHTESHFPNFTLQNCKACHNDGTFEVPNQSKSMPGLISGTAALTGWDRNVGVTPGYVSGPAARACGACHRAAFINEDDAGGLAAFVSHTATMGTYLETTSANQSSLLDGAISKIMSLFK